MSPANRKLVTNFHLWLGLPSAAVFLVVALTGAILVFEKDLDRALNPELWRASPAAPQSLDALAIAARAAVPDRPLKEIRLTATAGAPVEFRFDKGRHLRLDAGSGAVLGTRARPESFFGIVERVHTSLVLGEVGKWIVIASSVILVGLLATGVVLWWPKQWRMLKGAITLAFSRKGRAFHFNLHNTLGFWSAMPLLAMALTGAIMGIKPLGEALRGRPGKLPPPVANSDASTPAASLDAVRAMGERAFPNWQELRLHAPRGREIEPEHGGKGLKLWRVEAVLSGTPHEHARSIAWLDPRSAELLRIDPFTALPLGARLRALARPIHDGSIFGRPTQVVAFAVVLILPVLSITGVALWWLRRRATQAQKRCAALGVRKSTPAIPTQQPSPSIHETPQLKPSPGTA
jgi:uncharacterized iron-regulated membrane protein